MKLAERGALIGGKLWVREIRKLTDSGHQTSVLSSNYQDDLVPLACAMFAGWSQENFFKYMREHYNLDRLVDYSLEEISDTVKVVAEHNRQIDSGGNSRADKTRHAAKPAYLFRLQVADDLHGDPAGRASEDPGGRHRHRWQVCPDHHHKTRRKT